MIVLMMTGCASRLKNQIAEIPCPDKTKIQASLVADPDVTDFIARGRETVSMTEVFIKGNNVELTDKSSRRIKSDYIEAQKVVIQYNALREAIGVAAVIVDDE